MEASAIRRRSSPSSRRISGRDGRREKTTSTSWDLSSRFREVFSTFILLFQLAFKLLGYLGLGYKWLTALLWLLFYAAILFPGFMQGIWHYFLSGRVIRSIPYGKQSRNTLDLFMPLTNTSKPFPVVIFVTGGAWIIGYKGWGTLLGWALSNRGIIMASLDYRNFPEACIEDMVEDVSTGIKWLLDNISAYGGDPGRIYLVSQSAGAHISCLAVFRAAERQSRFQEENSAPWSPLQLKAFMGISGPYEIGSLVSHFHGRGLDRSIFLKIMGGEENLTLVSPVCLAQNPLFEPRKRFMPPFYLFHGTSDISVPFSSSENFASALQDAGVAVKILLLEDKTHTDLIIHDLMRGGTDELLESIIAIVEQREFKEGEVHSRNRVLMHRMLPEPLIQLARAVSPF